MKNKIVIRKFTLIEVLLAMMISSIITVTLGTVIFNVTKSYGIIKNKSNQLKDYCNMDRLVDNIFKNAVPFSWKNRQAKSNIFNQQMYFSGQEKYLLLSSKQPIYSKNDTGFVFTEFKVIDHQLLVRYKSTPFLQLHEFNSNEDGNIDIISKNVESISFLYGKFLKNGELIFLDNYLIEDEKLLPVAIQITVKWRDGRNKSWLRRTAGASRYGALGKSNIDPLSGKML